MDEEVDVTITAAAAGGTIIVQEGDVDVDVAAATIDFNASDFAVTSAPAGEANVALEANLDRNARVAVNKNSGATVGTRRRLNFIEGTNVTLTIADDAGNEEVDITINAAGGGSLVVQENDVTVDAAATTLDFLGADFDVTSSPAGEANIQLATTLTSNARVAVNKNSGATVSTRRRINFIEDTGITLTIADDAGNEEVDGTIAAAVGAAESWHPFLTMGA